MNDLTNVNCSDNRRKGDTKQPRARTDTPSASEAPEAPDPRPSRISPKPATKPRSKRDRKRSSSSSTSSSSSDSSSGSSSSSSESNARKKKRSSRRHRRSKRKGGAHKSKDGYQLETLTREVSELRKQLAHNEQRNRVSFYDAVPNDQCATAVEHNEHDGFASPHYADCEHEPDILIDDNVSGVLYDGVDERGVHEPDQSQLQFSFDFETKLKEPSVPKAPESFLKILQDIQYFDKKDWCEVRYSEVQKLYNHTPGFIDLEANDEIRSYDLLRHLAYADKAYSALTFCILKQRQALQSSLKELLVWARGADNFTVEGMHEKINDLFSKGEYSKISSDLLQLVCGHRAEVIQMRRDGITNYVRDPLIKSTLRKIPPSDQCLFNAESFTAALEKIGGVKKAFLPLNKPASSGPGSQSGTNKTGVRHPSQGSAHHYGPSQGTNHGYYAPQSHPHYRQNQASQACCHNRPSQGHNNNSVDRRPVNSGRGSFRPRGSHQSKYYSQGKANRKRSGAPADHNSGGKKRKY